MKLRPLADNVILTATEAEETTKSGIILSTANKEKPVMYEVVAVGPGGFVKGHEVVMTVKPGEKVLVKKFIGSEHKLEDGMEYVIVSQEDILAVVE